MRDPFVDPVPGDVLQSPNGRQVHVHEIRNGEVLFGAWIGEESHGTLRVSLETWRRDAPDAKIIQRGDECS